jgi:hypothetical protein
LSGSKLNIQDLDDDYTAESSTSGVMIDFPSAGNLLIRVKLAGDELEVENYIRKNKIEITPEKYEEYLIACMFAPNGGTLQERYELVHNKMTADDHMIIKGFEELFDFGVKNYSEFTCMECKEVSKVSFNFDLTTFFPSVSDTRDIRARILSRKGVESTSGHNTSNGSSQSALHTEDSREIHKDSEAHEETERGDETKIELTQEELQDLIKKEMAKVTQESVNKEVDYSSLRER